MFSLLNYDIFTVGRVCASENTPLDCENLRIRSITTSSLEVKPGSLFVPLIDRRDGHVFIDEAMERGAVTFFLKDGHPIIKKLKPEVRQRAIVVKDPLLALGELAHFHRRRFAPLVIAVTGSNGKTTTKEMLGQMFRSALGPKCVSTEKNYNNHIGVPFTLFRIRKNTRVAIIEMGMNHAGEIAYLSRLAEPHAAVISSIGHAHIEYLGSRQAIAQAKAEIMLGLGKGGSLYVPAGIAEYKTIAAIAKKAGHAVRSIDVNGNSALRIIESSAKGYTLQLEGQRLLFPHASAAWVSNLALATQVAIENGLSVSNIARTVKTFKPAAGRMQVHRGRFTLIDDGYNANPDSAMASIDSALQIADGKPVVCIFGEFKELGKFSKTLHEWTGIQAAKKGVSMFLGMGQGMRHAVRAFAQNAPKGNEAKWFDRKNTSQLVKYMGAQPRSAVVLVKGSRSMKMEEIVALLRNISSNTNLPSS
jgi:UDP-N-acetylmuramoyl-tripeptide--D-alanyl-D-alanine ligase